MRTDQTVHEVVAAFEFVPEDIAACAFLAASIAPEAPEGWAVEVSPADDWDDVHVAVCHPDWPVLRVGPAEDGACARILGRGATTVDIDDLCESLGNPYKMRLWRMADRAVHLDAETGQAWQRQGDALVEVPTASTRPGQPR